jgi:hypothetical protein
MLIESPKSCKIQRQEVRHGYQGLEEGVVFALDILGIGSYTFPRPVPDPDPPFYASLLTGIIGMNYHTQPTY